MVVPCWSGTLRSGAVYAGEVSVSCVLGDMGLTSVRSTLLGIDGSVEVTIGCADSGTGVVRPSDETVATVWISGCWVCAYAKADIGSGCGGVVGEVRIDSAECVW